MNYTVTASHIALGAAIEAAAGHLDVATAGVVKDAWSDIKNKAIKPALKKIERLTKVFVAGLTTFKGWKSAGKAIWNNIFNKIVLAQIIYGLITGVVAMKIASVGVGVKTAVLVASVPSMLLWIAQIQNSIRNYAKMFKEWAEIHDASAKQKAFIEKFNAQEQKFAKLGVKLQAVKA